MRDNWNKYNICWEEYIIVADRQTDKEDEEPTEQKPPREPDLRALYID